MLKVVLPDNRHKFQSDVTLQEIIDFIKNEMESFKLFQIQYSGHYQSQMKVLRVVILAIVQKMEQALADNRLDIGSFKQTTQWHINRLTFLKEYFVGIYKIEKEKIRQDSKNEKLTLHRVEFT